MEFKYAILSANPTIEELEDEIKRLTSLKTDFENQDQGLKIIINSLYGCAGYKNYMGYDIDIASSITGQSGHITQWIKDRTNVYFQKNYQKDTELHEKLGIKPPSNSYENSVKYCDTDSIFFTIEKIYKDSGYSGEFVDFALGLYEHRLKGYFADKLSMYCTIFNAFGTKMDGQPSFKLALDYISHSILWVMKKKYVKDIAYKKGIRYKSLEKIEITGLESNKAMVPKFVRDELKKIIKEILIAWDKGGRAEVEKVVNFEAKRVRYDFDLKKVDEICNATRISDYEAAVKDDNAEVIVDSKASPAIKGAALYNWMLTNHPNETIRNLYPRIQSGMKVYTYNMGNVSNFEYFSFPVGDFPTFCPDVDRHTQFDKVFLNPLNNIVKALVDELTGDPMKIDDPTKVVMPPMW